MSLRAAAVWQQTHSCRRSLPLKTSRQISQQLTGPLHIDKASHFDLAQLWSSTQHCSATGHQDACIALPAQAMLV